MSNFDFTSSSKSILSLAISSAGDLQFSRGSFSWCPPKQSISQKIVSILRRHKNEWFLHPLDGIDWISLVQQPAQATHLFSYAISQALLKWIPNLQILDLQINFLYSSKTLSITLSCLVGESSHLVKAIV